MWPEYRTGMKRWNDSSSFAEVQQLDCEVDKFREWGREFHYHTRPKKSQGLPESQRNQMAGAKHNCTTSEEQLQPRKSSKNKIKKRIREEQVVESTPVAPAQQPKTGLQPTVLLPARWQAMPRSPISSFQRARPQQPP